MSRMKDFLCGLADAQLAQFADILREQIAQRRMRGREYKSLRQNLELAAMILLMRQKKKDFKLRWIILMIMNMIGNAAAICNSRAIIIRFARAHNRAIATARFLSIPDSWPAIRGLS